MIKRPVEEESEATKITESGIRQVFQLYGEGYGNSVRAADLRVVFEQMGYPMSDEHCENLIETADRDGDGSLDLKEFVNFVLYGVLNIDDTEEEIMDCFRVFDPHDTGFIASEDLRKIMTQLGDELTDAEINKMIAESDIDGDGSINYAEYVKKIYEGNKRYEELNKRNWNKIFKKMKKIESHRSLMNISMDVILIAQICTCIKADKCTILLYGLSPLIFGNRNMSEQC